MYNFIYNIINIYNINIYIYIYNIYYIYIIIGTYLIYYKYMHHDKNTVAKKGSIFQTIYY